MITPSKHMNLDLSIMRVAAFILKNLHRYRIMSVDKVFNLVQKKAGEDGALVLSPALSFLYLIGKVEYHPQTDSLEFLDT